MHNLSISNKNYFKKFTLDQILTVKKKNKKKTSLYQLSQAIKSDDPYDNGLK